jgi:hypothetical protein
MGEHFPVIGWWRFLQKHDLNSFLAKGPVSPSD